jgi:hypothetical protein
MFLLEILLVEICFNIYIHEPKSLAAEIPTVFMAFTHTKKAAIWSFSMARIRIQIRNTV